MGPPKESGAEAAGSITSLANLLMLLRSRPKVKSAREARRYGAWEVLAEQRLASPYSGEDDFVFSSSEGTPLGIRNIARRGLEPALSGASLPKMRWHDLRHVCASALIEHGA